MDSEQADFFKAKLLPIIRETAEDREEPRHDRNPLRPMLRQVIRYVDYLEAKTEVSHA
jgi:hypothetical protein